MNDILLHKYKNNTIPEYYQDMLSANDNIFRTTTQRKAH